MTPAQQLDIIRSVEAVESMDEGVISKRDLEVSMKHKTLKMISNPYCAVLRVCLCFFVLSRVTHHKM